MKTIFLDIDGVLNSCKYLHENIKRADFPNEKVHPWNSEKGWIVEAINNLMY